jgi:hypothetical protein
MEESLGSTMNTELDLSFGVSAGFAVADKAEKVRSVATSAAAGTRRPNLVDPIRSYLRFYFKLRKISIC